MNHQNKLQQRSLTMKKLRRTFEQMTEDTGMLLTIFMSTMLATLGNSVFLSWATTQMGEIDWIERIVLTVVSTLIYCGIIVATFYLLLPEERRLLLKQRVMRK
jgi:hypothetical protein